MAKIRECLCQLCGAEYTVWFAPNELWNKVMRIDGTDKYQFLCPTCFCKEAERAGIVPTAWKITEETKNAPKDVDNRSPKGKPIIQQTGTLKTGGK